MLICDITQAYADISGGIKTYLNEKRKYIQANTHDEHVLIIPGEKDSLTRQGRITLCTIKAPFVPKYKPYRFIVNLKKVYQRLLEFKPDVIEFGSPFVLPWPIYLYQRQSQCTVVGYYHTDFPHAYVGEMLRQRIPDKLANIAQIIAEKYARAIYHRCDSTLTGSPMFIKRLQSFDLKNIEYLPLGVDLTTFNPDKYDKAFRDELQLKTDELLYVYAGRFCEEKRLDILLEAIEQLPAEFKCRFLFVGDGPSRPMIDAHVAKSPRSHFLIYENSREKLARVLASADVFVTAAPHETFGLLLVEAQACGLPIVGVQSGALRDRVQPGTGLLATPNDSRALTLAIQQFASQDYQLAGCNARKLVENTFSWHKTFSHLLNHYRSLNDKEQSLPAREAIQVQIAQY